MSPGSDVQCGNRSGSYWTALGETASLPTCSQVLQAGSGEAALPFWRVGVSGQSRAPLSACQPVPAVSTAWGWEGKGGRAQGL